MYLRRRRGLPLHSHFEGRVLQIVNNDGSFTVTVLGHRLVQKLSQLNLLKSPRLLALNKVGNQGVSRLYPL